MPPPSNRSSQKKIKNTATHSKPRLWMRLNCSTDASRCLRTNNKTAKPDNSRMPQWVNQVAKCAALEATPLHQKAAPQSCGQKQHHSAAVACFAIASDAVLHAQQTPSLRPLKARTNETVSRGMVMDTHTQRLRARTHDATQLNMLPVLEMTQLFICFFVTHHMFIFCVPFQGSPQCI